MLNLANLIDREPSHIDVAAIGRSEAEYIVTIASERSACRYLAVATHEAPQFDLSSWRKYRSTTDYQVNLAFAIFISDPRKL
jgi:hypothetical protein